MHFFSPVEKMQLVEVITTKDTSEEALHRVVKLSREMNTHVVVVNDGPGFFTSRVLSAFLGQALLCYAEGTPADQIDAALTELGFPVGPMTLIDEVGLDVAAKVNPTCQASLAVESADLSIAGRGIVHTLCAQFPKIHCSQCPLLLPILVNQSLQINPDPLLSTLKPIVGVLTKANGNLGRTRLGTRIHKRPARPTSAFTHKKCLPLIDFHKPYYNGRHISIPLILIAKGVVPGGSGWPIGLR